MESARCSGTGSGNSGTYATEMTETFRFEEEIQSLMRDNNLVSQGFECSPTETHGGSSFTALLGLHPTQAMELLHELDPKSVQFSLGCSRTFPSDAALMERATRFSIFAATQDSPEGSSAFPSNSDDNNNLSTNPNKPDPPDSFDLKPQRTTKRKESEKTSKAKNQSKKGKSFSGDEDGCSPATIDGEKLPYVHVRARRGQATDSHSLAERARREKINARMKLLQELVPGCSKISGTALVLDEIINHVQLLQRQVEILSMRLAAVNPRIDFTSLDSILSTEVMMMEEDRRTDGFAHIPRTERLKDQCGRVTASGHGLGWTDGTSNAVIRRRHHLVHQHHPHLHQIWTVDLQRHQQQEEWERDEEQQQQHVFMSGCGSGSPPGTSLFGYDSVTSAVPLSNQLKSEM